MKVRVKFTKQGAVKYIGHLDIMRYFQKAIRRSGIDIAYSQGYNPHMIMSFAAPLGVGITSRGEYFDIELTAPVSSKEAVRRLNETMAEGIEILSVRHISDEKISRAMSLVAAADYLVSFRKGQEPKVRWKSILEEFYQQDNIIVWKKTKKSEKQMDIKPFIYELHMDEKGEIFMKLASGSENNIKPSLVMEAFADFAGFPLKKFSFHVQREEIYAKRKEENISSFITLEDLGEEIKDVEI